MDLAAQLSANPLAALPVLFGAGVLTSLTPCVYPMIPITAAIVGGQSAAERAAAASAAASGAAPPRTVRWRPIALTLAYVVGLAVVYAGLGLFAGLTGTLFGSVSTNQWALLAMANVLLLSALAMLDVIPVRMPRALTTRAATAGTAGRATGAFVMGAASGVVAAPCSAPVMAAVLTWVATTRSAGMGFLYLLTFSLGMCSLLVAVGLSSGALARLPRAGMWMVWIKRLFALLMLGAAEYYLIQAGTVWF
ncbi:MAG TPA: cytochrome c biogenesis protein CcdA [Gemmatirosa sp.]|nr:cytochrome c biogenesis protein CcdA [Gemmatirosa sp.]